MQRDFGRGTGRQRSTWAAISAVTAAGALCATMAATSAQSPDVTLAPGGGDEVQAIITEVFGGPDVSDSLQAYWTATFPTFSDQPYHDPQGGFFPYGSGQGSGGACAESADDAAQNAAYCGGDESITYDVDWLGSLYAKSGEAGPITVLAHEWGHHIQHLAGEPAISKSAELQADCYAGMYLRSLADAGVIDDSVVTDSLKVTYSLGDDPSTAGAWTDPDVHGTPTERRQAEGVGYSTGVGDFCVAYGDWQDQPPAPLFDDKTIRVEPFSDPTTADDGSYVFTLPGATVQVVEENYPADTTAAGELVAALQESVPDAATWDIATPADGWLEALGWGTGSGATTTFRGTAADGSVEAGAAALQIDPSGTAQLYIAVGANTTDTDSAVGQGQDALDALTWGYCDPEAEVTTNCAADQTGATPGAEGATTSP